MEIVARHNILDGFYVKDGDGGREQLISFGGAIALIKRGEIPGYKIVEHEGVEYIVSTGGLRLSELPERKNDANIRVSFMDIENNVYTCEGEGKDGSIKSIRCDVEKVYAQAMKGKIKNASCKLGVDEEGKNYRVLEIELN